MKKPNFKKLVGKSKWTWWEGICLIAEIDPPKNYQEYIDLKSKYKPLREMEKKFIEKGFFEDFGIPRPAEFN